MGTEENGRCREVEKRVNVQADRQKKWPLQKAGSKWRFDFIYNNLGHKK